MNELKPLMRMLKFLTGLSSSRPKTAIAALLLLVALAVLGIAKAEFGSDVTRLVPTHAEKTSLYFDLLRDFGGMEKLYIVFRAEDLGGARLGDIDKIGEALSATGLFKDVRWKVTDEMRSFVRDTLLGKMPLYLSPAEMSAFLGKLSPEGMEAELKKTKMMLGLPGGGISGLDPLNLFEAIGTRAKFSDVSFDLQTGYFLTPDGRMLIMTAIPLVSPRDITGTDRMLKTVNSIIKGSGTDGLRAEITGNHAITHYEASIMKREIAFNIAGSLIGVTLIFLLAFGGLRGFIAAIIPVVTAIVLSMGLMGLFWGSITEVSGAFGAILIGLGIDLGIVLYVRYIMNASRGLTRDEAIKTGVRGAGRSITFGVLTTAATFFPMAFSSFRGIREIGILTGMGILFTWALVFSLFPMLVNKGSEKKPRARKPRRPKFGFVEKIFYFSYRHPVAIISVASLITASAALFVGRVSIEGDLTKLGAKENPARDTLQMLTDNYLSRHTVFLTGTAATPEEASERSARIKSASGDSPADSFSVSDILPPPSRQAENIEAVSKIDARAFERNFRQKAALMGFDPSAFDGYLKTVRSMLENKKQVTAEDLAPIDDVLERVLSRAQNGGYRFVIMQKGSPPNEDSLKAEGVAVTGPAFVREELLGLLRRDAALMTAIGFMLVSLLLFADFRRPYRVILTQLPVLISFVIVLGFMGLFGITLNFMNAIVFVMLFGIGTDYTIHLLHRYDENGDIKAIASETGSAVFLAGTTTVAAFGSMAFSSYRGLSSMGAVSGLGVLCCVILSLTLIPALFRLYEKTSYGK